MLYSSPMIAFFLTLGRFIGAIRQGLRDPEFRSLLILVVIILATGTLFYANVEGWNALDALYFSVITLTTVGYGDLTPKTPAGKVFTIVYLLIGIGVLLAFVERVASNAMQRPKAEAKDDTTTGPEKHTSE